MSRGLDVAKADEMAAVWAIGQAINYITIDILNKTKLTDDNYDSIRSGVAEDMAFWLESEFKKSKYYYIKRIL